MDAVRPARLVSCGAQCGSNGRAQRAGRSRNHDPLVPREKDEAGGSYGRTSETYAHGSVGIGAGADGGDGEFAARGGRPGTGQESLQGHDRLCRRAAVHRVRLRRDPRSRHQGPAEAPAGLIGNGDAGAARQDPHHAVRRVRGHGDGVRRQDAHLVRQEQERLHAGGGTRLAGQPDERTAEEVQTGPCPLPICSSPMPTTTLRPT